MNPTFIMLCASLQVAILFVSARWTAGALFSLLLVAILAMLAFTHQRWHPHLDMALLMAGPGGLGMMLGMILPDMGWGPACHFRTTWTSYALMSAGMLVIAIPLCWKNARCLREARREGFGGRALMLDLVGMQIGMTVAHFPLGLLPLADPRSLWLHHALMLTAMLVGMLGGMLVMRSWRGRDRWPAMVGRMA